MTDESQTIPLGFMPSLSGGCEHDVPSCIGVRYLRFLDIDTKEKMIDAIISLFCSNEERATTIRNLRKEINRLKSAQPLPPPPPYEETTPKPQFKKKKIVEMLC